jgi:predicted MPP superfamily phosphohydrolase
MAAPRPARPRLRRLFDPVSGWFRRSERGVNQWLSRSVYPRLPILARVYGAILHRRLTVSEADIAVRDLPEAFDGLTVLLVTDIHLGPFLAPLDLERTFRRLRGLEPDLIVLGGDLTTSRVSEFSEAAELFGVLKAPLGVHAVMGNHDHYNDDPEGLRRAVASAGIEVLHNRHVVLRRDGESLVLAGIDDLNIGSPDLDAALEGAPDEAPVVLVSHNPDVFFEAADRGVALVLAGHTHGGQVRIPGLPVLTRMSRYRLDEGRYAARGADLVVSRGVGVVGLPLRLACPPEAVLVRLRCG